MKIELKLKKLKIVLDRYNLLNLIVIDINDRGITRLILIIANKNTSKNLKKV